MKDRNCTKWNSFSESLGGHYFNESDTSSYSDILYLFRFLVNDDYPAGNNACSSMRFSASRIIFFIIASPVSSAFAVASAWSLA
jgi:hypothetical protein